MEGIGSDVVGEEDEIRCADAPCVRVDDCDGGRDDPAVADIWGDVWG